MRKDIMLTPISKKTAVFVILGIYVMIGLIAFFIPLSTLIFILLPFGAIYFVVMLIVALRKTKDCYLNANPRSSQLRALYSLRKIRRIKF